MPPTSLLSSHNRGRRPDRSAMSVDEAGFRLERRNRAAAFLLLRCRLSSGLPPHRLPSSDGPLFLWGSCGPPSSQAVGVFCASSPSMVVSGLSGVSCSTVTSSSAAVSCMAAASGSWFFSDEGGDFIFHFFFCFYRFLLIAVYCWCGFGC